MRSRYPRRCLQVINSTKAPEPPPVQVIVKSPYMERRVCVTAQAAIDLISFYGTLKGWLPGAIVELQSIYALAYPTFWVTSGGLELQTPFQAFEDAPDGEVPPSEFHRKQTQILDHAILCEMNQVVLAGLLACGGGEFASYEEALLERKAARKHVGKKLRKMLKASVLDLKAEVKDSKRAFRTLEDELNSYLK